MTYNPRDLWDSRATQYGRRAVIDLGLSNSEAAALTALQEDVLLHRLDQVLDYKYHGHGLDFGCGVGRFTKQLAIRCSQLICYDPSPKLINMARADNKDVKGCIHWCCETPDLFLRTNWSFRFIWISLVLGGIPDDELPTLAFNLGQHVAVGGVVLFAEHISEVGSGSEFWRFRPISQYLALFNGFRTRLVDSYVTRGNTVGVFEARKL